MKYRVSSARPLNKVLAGGAGSALAVVAIWLVRRYVWPDLSDDVAAALGVLVVSACTIVAGYFTPIAPGEIEPGK